MAISGLTQSFIYEPITLKVPCGGFNFLGGHMGETVYLYSGSTYPVVTVDNTEPIGETSSGTSLYRAEKTGIFTEILLPRYMLEQQSVDDDAVMFSVIDKQGVPLNAISCLNILGSYQGVKCVGITKPYNPDELSEEERRKMAVYDTITESMTSFALACAYTNSSANLGYASHTTFETEALSPTLNDFVPTLVLTLDEAYLAVPPS